MLKIQVNIYSKKVLSFLNRTGESSIEEMLNELDLKEHEICIALGWLSHMKKIILVEKCRKIKAIVYDKPA